MKTKKTTFEEIKKLIKYQKFELAKQAIYAAEKNGLIYLDLYIELAKILSYEGNTKEAEEILINQYNTKGHHTDRILTELMHLYIKTEEYDKAKFFLSEYFKLPESMATDEQKKYMKCCIKKGLGEELTEEDQGELYYCEQINNYSKEKAIKFIYNTFFFEENMKQTIFCDDVNIYSLFDDIKKFIEPKYLYPATGCFDKYLFEVKNVGVEFTGKPCNYFKVFVQKNTKNIITIIPMISIFKGEQYCFDLKALLFENELNELDYKAPFVKTRIDQFNKKYNIG